LDIDHLLQRIDDEGIQELIIATNPTLEGETTALFLARLLEGKDVKVTRLAYGLPMGASLDYADSMTLQKALEGRKKL
jgi:recombination protein RecR